MIHPVDQDQVLCFLKNNHHQILKNLKVQNMKLLKYIVIGVFLYAVSQCMNKSFDTYDNETGEYLDENWNDTTKRPFDIHGLDKNNEK